VQDTADVDEVVGNDAEANPSLHSIEALVSASAETCRRLATLIRPSDPVRHFWPLRNQRFLCSRRRSALLVERLWMQTRFTPLAFAAALFLAE